MSVQVEDKIRRLNNASLRRVIEPDTEVPGEIGPGQVLPDSLLSTAGLDLDLTPEQKARLSREEIGSITQAGIRFEAILEAGFAMEVVRSQDLTDPRITYLLHEMGEETRHQRLFIRLLSQTGATTSNPLDNRVTRFIMRAGARAIISLPALLYTLVLGGEEIPDMFQKIASEHPDTDPFIRAVNKYHRMEEARHLSFARTRLPEVWAEAGPIEKIAVRRVAPFVIRMMFDEMVHPGVYATIGLPAMKTWRAANATPVRKAMRAKACRSVVDAMVDAGIFAADRLPKRWQQLLDGEDEALVASLTPDSAEPVAATA
ncbi:MAG: putative rane protein [Acidimicrobiales bacterium]|nr:putative rane protein [Acidimicrobiales bacterium]